MDLRESIAPGILVGTHGLDGPNRGGRMNNQVALVADVGKNPPCKFNHDSEEATLTPLQKRNSYFGM